MPRGTKSLKKFPPKTQTRARVAQVAQGGNSSRSRTRCATSSNSNKKRRLAPPFLAYWSVTAPSTRFLRRPLIRTLRLRPHQRCRNRNAQTSPQPLAPRKSARNKSWPPCMFPR